mmetsp:Transcript_42038/g.102603  ORF Transcript_42038/g.102603 Transcript_42038/m.102603 type:complete len:329 (-) Transcript_42038:182-1168(-)
MLNVLVDPRDVLVHLQHSVSHVGRTHVGPTTVADHDVGKDALCEEAHEGLADGLWRLAQLREALDDHLLVPKGRAREHNGRLDASARRSEERAATVLLRDLMRAEDSLLLGLLGHQCHENARHDGSLEPVGLEVAHVGNHGTVQLVQLRVRLGEVGGFMHELVCHLPQRVLGAHPPHPFLVQRRQGLVSEAPRLPVRTPNIRPCPDGRWGWGTRLRLDLSGRRAQRMAHVREGFRLVVLGLFCSAMMRMTVLAHGLSTFIAHVRRHWPLIVVVFAHLTPHCAITTGRHGALPCQCDRHGHRRLLAWGRPLPTAPLDPWTTHWCPKHTA